MLVSLELFICNVRPLLLQKLFWLFPDFSECVSPIYTSAVYWHLGSAFFCFSLGQIQSSSAESVMAKFKHKDIK